MTDAPMPGRGTYLDFMAPLSAQRADRLVDDLVALKPSTVIDLGCGWGELLLRIVAADPSMSGTGIDTHAPDVLRGRNNAAERGLSDRVTFVEGPAADHQGSADVVISVGAYQAFGSVAAAFRALHDLVNPGGRLLFGGEFWEHAPTAEQLAHMWPGITADDCTDVAGLVDQAIAAGFRPLRIETATRTEWEEFESGLAADVEEWLLANVDHPDADEVRTKLDTQRNIWLRGESFLTLIEHRFERPGLYVMDEPESALSLQGQLRLLRLIHDRLQDGSQFILATHSPLLMRMPGATIYELGDDGIRSCDFDDLTVVNLWRRFLAAPERLLDILLGDDD